MIINKTHKDQKIKIVQCTASTSQQNKLKSNSEGRWNQRRCLNNSLGFEVFVRWVLVSVDLHAGNVHLLLRGQQQRIIRRLDSAPGHSHLSAPNEETQGGNSQQKNASRNNERQSANRRTRTLPLWCQRILLHSKKYTSTIYSYIHTLLVLSLSSPSGNFI